MLCYPNVPIDIVLLKFIPFAFTTKKGYLPPHLILLVTTLISVAITVAHI